MSDTNNKIEVARALAKRVSGGELLGLGSGSTTELAIIEIGNRSREQGFSVRGVATSARTARLAADNGIEVLDAATVKEVDWAFDGADEVDPKLNMIKGRGGAMLSEKIVAKKAGKLIILVTEDKLVKRLGEKFPIPVEVVPEALELVLSSLNQMGALEIELRNAERKYGPVISEHGNFILDVSFKEISSELERDLSLITGVVESGLFTGLKPEVLIAGSDGLVSRAFDGDTVKDSRG